MTTFRSYFGAPMNLLKKNPKPCMNRSSVECNKLVEMINSKWRPNNNDVHDDVHVDTFFFFFFLTKKNIIF